MVKIATKKAPAKAKAEEKPAKAKTNLTLAKNSSKAKKSEKTKSEKTVKAKKAETKYEIGEVFEFVGYTEESEDDMFTAGQHVQIVNVDKDEEGNALYSCILAEDAEAYAEDPESVEGDELIAAELKPLKKSKSTAVAKKEPEPISIVNVGDLNKLVKREGSYLAVAHKQIENIHENFFYLGGALAHLFFEGTYKESNEDWDEFCQENFGFKGRKGRYWIDIYQTFSKLPNFDIKQLPTIGWSKAAELARYITEDNQDELVDLAKEQNITDLKATLQSDYTSEGVTANGRQATRSSGSVKRTTYAFKLFEDQAEVVNYVLSEAQKHFGTDDLNQVFERIVTEWGDSTFGQTKAKKLKRLAAKAEKAEAEREEA